MRTDEEPKDPSQIIAAMAYDVVNREGPFATVSDFAAALKERCARLKIPYTTPLVNAAMRQVARAKPDVLLRPSVRVGTHEQRERQAADGVTLSRADAERVCRRLMARFKAEQPRTPRTDDGPDDFPDLVPV